ncbi:MAG: hypothetical protein ACYC46_07370 [Acidobacteriaceae bacterium]
MLWKMPKAGTIFRVSVYVVFAGAMVAAPLVYGQNPAFNAGSSDPATHITKAQAKELFRSVDDILKFASQDTQYPILHPVKRRLTSREAVMKYILKQFNEDASSKRMQRSEIELKKFGLLDRDFHLRPFLVSLLTEQIAGYYNNKTKAVNLLDWIPPDEQKPVLAHELTHALQDQHVDLQKWEDPTGDSIAKNAVEDNQHLATDEEDDTRDAVLEGQAMAVFIDYSLRPVGKSLLTAPELVQKMKDAMADNSSSPVMSRAPLLLQQSLMFPYREGLSFEQAVLQAAGPKRAFAGTLDQPPTSSYEIMNPQAYLQHQPVPMLHMPDIHPLIDQDYNPYDIGVMGALDVRIMTDLFGGDEMSAALTPEWDGGMYYAAQKKSAVTPEQKSSTASLSVFYLSRWKDEDSAQSFLRIYANELSRKYDSLKRMRNLETNQEEQVYSTNEGDVLLAVEGTSVFVSEGFDLSLARKLKDMVLAAQSDAPLNIASRETLPAGMNVPNRELSSGLVRFFGNAGLMQAGLQGVEAVQQ